MKYLLLLGVLLFGASGAYGQGENLPTSNPCDDPIYKKLVSMPLDSMSERQYSYFTIMHEKCRTRQASEAEADAIYRLLHDGKSYDKETHDKEVAERKKKAEDEEKAVMAVLWSLFALSLVFAIVVSI